MTKTETNTITSNDERNNGGVEEAKAKVEAEEEAEAKAKAEAEAEAEAATNSAKLNSSHNRIGSSNSKSNYVETKISKCADKNKNKTIGNNVGYDGENSSKTRESQQQNVEIRFQ